VPETNDADYQEAPPKLGRGMSTVKTKNGLRLSSANGADIEVDDLQGDNIVMTQDEFNSMVRNISVKGQRVQNLRRYLGVAALLIFALAVVSFAMSWLAAEASKESHVEGALLVNTQGEPLQVASSDLKVNDDGTMVKQCKDDSCSSRRLSGTDDIALKTTPTKHKQVLTSSLSDAYLMSLTEVVVFSDKGHTLRITVHGFARVPVANSRCGNIVHLYTAWNGRLTLDSDDLSFDESTEEAFLHAGFSLAIGGVSGRRLTSQHNVEGFFTAVQGMEDSDSWNCQDVPLPTLPEYFTQTLTIYAACAVAGTAGDVLEPCDSRYGGVVPGVHALPEVHQHAIMAKTARIKATLGVDVSVEDTLFVKSEVEVLRAPSYQIQQTRMPNHPGQIKVSVYDRVQEELVEFQLLADLVSDGRFYCNFSAGEMTPQKAEQEAPKSGVKTEWHMEFLDLVEEGGMVYRHFRMMPDESFLTWMGAKSPSERPTDAYWEYWDNAETLAPYRLVSQDGSVTIFESTTAGADDSAAEALLASMGKGSAWDDAMTCLPSEQDNDEPVAYTNGFLLPQMLTPMADLDKEALQFYAAIIGGTDTDWVDNTSADNAGWDSLVAIGKDGALADFAEYARKSTYPLAMPDVCEIFCPDVVEAVGTAARATEDVCATPGLDHLSACIFEVATVSVHACGKSPAAMIIQECTAMADSATRRLSGGDEVDEEGDFEEEGEEEDKMKVTTISSGAIKQAADPQTPMPVISKLADGSNSLDLEDLDDGVRAQLGRMLNLENPPKTGRILFNSTSPVPGVEIKKVEGLVDLPGVDSPTASRRLWFDMKCLWPNVGPGCIFSVWWPKSGTWCDPIDDSPPCKFSIAVKIQPWGPSAGAITVAGSGCIEAWKFSVPPPFDGSVCIAGGITFNFAKSCGNKFPFTIYGHVSLTKAIGLNFGIFSFTAFSMGLEIGAGIANYATHCWENRRRRRWWGGGTRRCNYACDVRVYGKIWRTVFWVVKIWAKVEYWVTHRDWNLFLGIDVCWPWPWSYCYTPVTIKVF